MRIKSKLLKRGSFSVQRGGRRSALISFMFNPSEVTRERGFSHGSAAVAGRSTPAYGGGSGTGESFQFTLNMDADRGFLEIRRNNSQADSSDLTRWFAAQADVNQMEDLRPYIDAVKSTIYPEEASQQTGYRSGVPPRIFLDLGSAISGEVAIDTIGERLWKFGSSMNVMRADLSISGHIIEETNITSVEFLRKYTGRTTGLPDVVHNDDFTDLPDVFSGGGAGFIP